MNRAWRNACGDDCRRDNGCAGARVCAGCGHLEYQCEMSVYEGAWYCDDCRDGIAARNAEADEEEGGGEWACRATS